MDKSITVEDGIVEKMTYDDDAGLVVETIYDNSDVIEQNTRDRNEVGMPVFGSKGQRMVKAASFHMGDIVRLKNMGYDLMSADPAEVHRALLYVRDNEQAFLTTDKKVIADRKVLWR